MKKSIHLSLLALILLLFAKPSLALIHLEPMIGHSVVGNWDMVLRQESVDGSIRFSNFGLRFGYQAPSGFQVGTNIDFSFGRISDFPSFNESSTSKFDLDFDVIEPYLMFGFQFKMGLRLFAGISLSSELDIDTSENLSEFTFSEESFTGEALKLGVGYLIADIVAVNLEYRFRQYEELRVFRFFGFDEFYQDFDQHSLSLSVSLPFDFIKKKRKSKKRKSKKETEPSDEQKP